MNARVDPAALRVPAEGDDAALIALCRVAMRALDKEEALEKAFNDLDDRCHDTRPRCPPHPHLEWGFSGRADPFLEKGRPQGLFLGSERLRELVTELGPEAPASWHEGMRTHLAAVVAWERACAAHSRSLGLRSLELRFKRATKAARQCVNRVIEMPATTLQGLGLKAIVAAKETVSVYGFDEIGRFATVVADEARRMDVCGDRRRARAA